jgi:NAD(P)-dependent dehydrogenase (short-subunit alcohol dehydrogenase family)
MYWGRVGQVYRGLKTVQKKEDGIMTAVPNHLMKGEFFRDLFELEGKVAVIVGGTGYLCGAMARGLLQAGCKVVLVGRNGDKAKAHFKAWNVGPDFARFWRADVTLRAEVESIISPVSDWHGKIDIWVNGAGVLSPTPYVEISDDEFSRLIEVNLRSVHLGCQTIGKHWIGKKQKGSIINVASMAAIRPLSRNFMYSLSKAALVNLTQNLAREWGPHGIRINSICPGFFPTAMNRAILDKSRVDAIMWHTPMGRFGEPEELIGATLLLASERAGSFITGTNLIVDGGFSVTSI